MPTVDINLFVHNGAKTLAAAIDSVLAQSWSDWRLTLIDDGSTDETRAIVEAYAAAYPAICIKRNRCNTGAVGAFQRGLWIGNADYVMPKSADDLLAPDFIQRIMDLLAAHPGCAMAHAAGLTFQGRGEVDFIYPESHRLTAISNDPVERASEVMRRYTSSPSFWGIYRRDAVDRLAPIAMRAGWDHVLLAELSLYGAIRHVPEVLYWRRGGGRPVRDLARAATVEAARGVALDASLADPLWRLPCITTVYAHIENFAVARLSIDQRVRLIADVQTCFGQRWYPLMQAELAVFRRYVLSATRRLDEDGEAVRDFGCLHLARMLTAVATVLPAADLRTERHQIAALLRQDELCLV
jgi:glycosyltransferase involved in cell wall biosynthesis